MTRGRTVFLGLVLTAVGATLFFGTPQQQGEEPKVEHGTAPTSLPGLSVRSIQHRKAPEGAGAMSQPSGPKAELGRTWVDLAVVRGQVVNSHGDPMASICVGVEGCSGAFTTDDGRFRIGVPGPGTYTLRALAKGAFYGEAEEDVVVAEDRTSEGVVLRFAAENSLRGQALLPDGRPAAGVVIKITTKSNDMALGRITRGIWSEEGASSWAACRTDAEGGFGFGGVDSRSQYRLWWMGDDGKPRQHPGDVNAGLSGLIIEVKRHRMAVDVVDRQTGAPVQAQLIIESFARARPASLMMEPRLNENSGWDEDGWIAPSGRRLRVIVYRAGYAISETRFMMGETWGEQIHHVALTPLRGPASLRIVCLDPEGRNMERVPLEFYYMGEDEGEAARLFPVLVERVGQQETNDLPPSRIRITSAELHETRRWASWRFLFPASTTIDVPAEGIVWARLQFERGGACALRFTGVPVDACYFLDYVLRDAHRNEVPVSWYLAEEVASTAAQDLLVTRGEAISTALRPGRYELTVSQSYTCYEMKTMTVPIEIEAGKLTRSAIHVIGDAERAR